MRKNLVPNGTFQPVDFLSVNYGNDLNVYTGDERSKEFILGPGQ